MFYEEAPYIFRTKASTQVVSDRTMTNIAWDTTEAAYLMTASTAGFTTQVAGVYLISVSAFYTYEAGFDGIIIRLIGAGGHWLASTSGPSFNTTTNSVMQTGSALSRLTAGEAVQAQVYTVVNPASSTTVGSAVASAEMFISAVWVGKY